MKTRFPRFLPLLAALSLAAATAFCAQEKLSVASLAFLTGSWRGTSSSGATAEELISTAKGGVMLCAGREFQGGKCIFYDLVVFAEQAGAVLLIPNPNGKRSADTFPLVAFDAPGQRATFENLQHDFPKKFVYELVAADHLRITLTGDQKGQPATEVYDLQRVQ